MAVTSLSGNTPCSKLLLHTKDIISANAAILSEKATWEYYLFPESRFEERENDRPNLVTGHFIEIMKIRSRHVFQSSFETGKTLETGEIDFRLMN